MSTFANAPIEINAARAAVLIGTTTAKGSYMVGDVTHTQYLTSFGLVTTSVDGWGDDQGSSLLRFKPA